MKLLGKISGRKCDPYLPELLDPGGQPIVPDVLRTGAKSETLQASVLEAGVFTVRVRSNPSGEGARLSLSIELIDAPVLKARECSGP